jgi:hypothetical protein
MPAAVIHRSLLVHIYDPRAPFVHSLVPPIQQATYHTIWFHWFIILLC